MFIGNTKDLQRNVDVCVVFFQVWAPRCGDWESSVLFMHMGASRRFEHREEDESWFLK